VSDTGTARLLRILTPDGLVEPEPDLGIG
jgi:hypothetical protein